MAANRGEQPRDTRPDGTHSHDSGTTTTRSGETIPWQGWGVGPVQPQDNYDRRS
jgi:hypothetical protein